MAGLEGQTLVRGDICRVRSSLICFVLALDKAEMIASLS